MYNPEGSDNNKEFIEIYFNENMNLENWTIADSQSNDILVLIEFHNSSYALIVEEGFNYSGINASIYSVGTTIGNNLNNDMDNVSLFDVNGMLIASISYDGTIANSNGYSMEFYNSSWYESNVIGGTPGRENSILENIIDTIVESNNISNQSNSSNNLTACNITLTISTEKLLYNNSEKVKYKHILSNDSFSFVIEYWIEDLFGNIVKAKYNSTNTNQKTWTPNIDSEDSAFLMKARLAYVNCSNSESHASEIIVVRGVEQKKDSRINFEKVPDAKFGSIAIIKIEIFKGNTLKSSISIYMVDSDGYKISEVSKINVYDRYTTNTFSVPIKIKDNCNDEFGDGYYKIIASGIGIEEKETIKISRRETSSCKEIKVARSCPVCETNDNYEINTVIDDWNNEPQLKSFYTLSKSYKPQINLYAGLKYPGNRTKAVLETMNSRNELVLNSTTEKIRFPVNISRGKNLFLLSLIKDNETIDLKPLVVEFENIVENISMNIPNMKGSKDVPRISTSIVKNNTASSDTVYESTSIKSKKFVLPIFILILVIIAIATYRQRF